MPWALQRLGQIACEILKTFQAAALDKPSTVEGAGNQDAGEACVGGPFAGQTPEAVMLVAAEPAVDCARTATRRLSRQRHGLAPGGRVGFSGERGGDALEALAFDTGDLRGPEMLPGGNLLLVRQLHVEG